MARIVDSSDPKLRESLDPTLRFHLYNALDAMVTSEILGEIKPQLVSHPTRLPDGEVRCFEKETYEFSRAMQAPVSDMMRAGLLVDDYTRGSMIASLAAERTKLERRLLRWLHEAMELTDADLPCLSEFNHRSNAPGGHLQQLFYGTLGLQPILAHNGKPTTDRDALERLTRYPSASVPCGLILALRDIEKVLSTLRTEIDTDGVMRTTLSIAGANTGRMSSYAASNGKGNNLQNQDPQLRHIFCARKGKKLCYIDLEQAESRLVGAIEYVLFGDSRYLDACESADLHTTVASMVWPHIKTREQAEETFARNFSFRFICKRISHGSNYYGTPCTISQETGVPAPVVEEFQKLYFKAFPAHNRWHKWCSQQLAAQGYLVSLMGRKRWFMGRHDDDATVREAIAYDPQSSIADLLNRGLFRLWWLSKNDPANYPVQLLLQVHDAVLLEYPEDADESTLIPRLMAALELPITLKHGTQLRTLIVPTAAESGWNWGEQTESNVDGLVKFNSKKSDTRVRKKHVSRSPLDTLLSS